MRNILFIAILLVVSGCASMNDAMTPSAHVEKDKFDGATIVNQDSVSASSSVSDENMHSLGFDWTSKSPDVVYITVGVYGVANISGVKFNADGKIIESAKPVATSTDYANATIEMVMAGSSGKTFSTRRFVMPIDDFRTIATAQDVRMRIDRINSYSVSTFGPANGIAIINTKFKPFLEKVDSIIAQVSK